MKIGNSKILEKMLEEHFKDDSRRFDNINAQLSKLEELITINGQHTSFFNKHLLEIKDTLIEQNKISDQRNTIFIAHQKRLEPMIKNWEENELFYKKAKVKGLSAGKFIAWASGLIIGAGIIRQFLLKIFNG